MPPRVIWPMVVVVKIYHVYRVAEVALSVPPLPSQKHLDRSTCFRLEGIVLVMMARLRSPRVRLRIRLASCLRSQHVAHSIRLVRRREQTYSVVFRCKLELMEVAAFGKRLE